MIRRSAIHILGVAAMAASCGGRGPTVQPTPVPDPPSLSCPADIALISRTSQPAPTASYDTPAAQGGKSPVTVACTPASQSEFQIGSTTVTCEATDSLARKASCTFAVVVTPTPRLEKTKFLAFGDSITAGEPAGLRRAGPIFPGNYAERLQAKLMARYEAQTFTMVNEGLGGEPTGRAKLRLGGVLTAWKPEVLMLIEGTNDVLSNQSAPSITSAAEAIQNMVRQGPSRGIRVFVATLPPLKLARLVSQAAVDAVPILNERIKAIAPAENVTLVDLYAVVTPDLIGSEGKHATPEGNQVIADTFFTAIMETLEIKPSTPLQSFGPVPGTR
jgi:lysophospholipase L1-like esterase